MNLRGVKLVGVAQMIFVQVPLVEWCLGRVVHSKLRVVNGIDNSHDLNYLGKLRETHLKNEVCNGLRVLILRIYGAGHGQTMKNIGLSSVLPYGI
jgi:hypothetical protein